MSKVAGRLSTLVGTQCLMKHHGGNGVLISGVPGVKAGKVVVIGGGTAVTTQRRWHMACAPR